MLSEDGGDFDKYGISDATAKALRAQGISKLFAIQSATYVTSDERSAMTLFFVVFSYAIARKFWESCDFSLIVLLVQCVSSVQFPIGL